jgi:hypothetical protein
MPAPVLVPISHIDRQMADLGSPPLDDPYRVVNELERKMTTLRQTVISLAVLTAFVLVLAAPFRW